MFKKSVDEYNFIPQKPFQVCSKCGKLIVYYNPKLFEGKIVKTQDAYFCEKCNRFLCEECHIDGKCDKCKREAIKFKRVDIQK